MLRINSKEVKENDTFLALKGVKKDGHDYIEEAIKNGASKIICEHGKYSVETIIVPSTREYLSNYLKDINGKNLHDTEKPVELMKILIENSSLENILMDKKTVAQRDFNEMDLV